MKHTILTTLIAAAAIFAAAPAADAQRHHHHHHHHAPHASYIFISGHHACGTPIYTERFIVRYDRHRRPVYGYRNVRHRPHHHVRPAPRGFRHHHVPPHYRVPTCPPPPRNRSGGYINIRF